MATHHPVPGSSLGLGKKRQAGSGQSVLAGLVPLVAARHSAAALGLWASLVAGRPRSDSDLRTRSSLCWRLPRYYGTKYRRMSKVSMLPEVHREMGYGHQMGNLQAKKQSSGGVGFETSISQGPVTRLDGCWLGLI